MRSRLCIHGYAVGAQCLFLRLVLEGVSLRGVPRVLEIMSAALGLSLPIPHWTTGRLWLLRLGHALLTMALAKSHDWAWLVDHSVQIGQEKCLVILGIRLADLPEPGECLQHTDLHLVALVPRKSWTRQEVDEELEAASQRTGIPRVIVDDHGVDIAGGVSFFQDRHPETVEIYDAKHKAACLLKSRLEKNARWQELQQRIGQTRCAIQQTEMAFLVPPAPKPKARFMNLAPTLQWAENVLAVLQQPPTVVSEQVSPERLEEKLGWLREFEAEVAEWAEWQQVVNVTVEFVNRQGIYRGVAKQLRTKLRPHREYSSSRCLAQELLAFVAKQARRARPGRTLSRKYRSVGIVLWAIQTAGKATIAGWLHESGSGVRSIAGGHHHGGGRASNEPEPDQGQFSMVHRPSGYHPVWPTKASVRRLRNKRRVKMAHTIFISPGLG